MSKTTRWALKPKGPYSNEIVAEALDFSDIQYLDEITLNTGDSIKGVWEVPSHAYIGDFMKAKREKNWNFDFDIFSKTGKSPWHTTPYLPDLHKKKSPAAKQAQQFVKMAKERTSSQK